MKYSLKYIGKVLQLVGNILHHYMGIPPQKFGKVPNFWEMFSKT